MPVNIWLVMQTEMPVIIRLIGPISWIAVLVLAGLVILIVNRSTRPWALGVLGVLVVGFLTIGFTSLRMTREVAYSVQPSPVTAPMDQAHENWDQATQPKIPLDDHPQHDHDHDTDGHGGSPAEVEDRSQDDHSTEHTDDLIGAPSDDQTDSESATPKNPSLPAWADQPSVRVGNVYRRVVSDGPYATADEARARVQEKIDAAVHEHLTDLARDYLRQEVAVPQLGELGISRRFIRDNIIAEEFYATRDTSVASDMKTALVLLEFNASVSDHLLGAWQAHARQARTRNVTIAACGVLGVLAGALGLIKLDTATKGYYTKRLFIGVPLAIIGTGALLFLA